MTLDTVGGRIRWRLHLRSSPRTVYEFLATNEGRAHFWAEYAVEREGAIDFRFSGRDVLEGADRRADRAASFRRGTLGRQSDDVRVSGRRPWRDGSYVDG